MIGLIHRAFRETIVHSVILASAMGLIMMLMTFILPQMQDGFVEVMNSMPFVRQISSAMMGIDLDDGVPATMLQSVIWVHPVVLSVLFTHTIMFGTRYPASEIDRGTIDILLGLPVSRREVFVSEVVGWLVSGLGVISVGVSGFLVGGLMMEANLRLPIGAVLRIMANMYLLYLAVGGLTFMVSACSSRRNRAVGIVLGVVIGSVLLNFLAQYWTPAGSVSFLGLLNYYRPSAILSTGSLPWDDVVVLGGFAAVSLVVGMEVCARRSICTT